MALRFVSVRLALPLLLICACGGKDVPVGGRDDAGGSADTGQAGAGGGDSGRSGFTLACWRGMPEFPPLDKSCNAPTDCFVARHMINCCGSLQAIGLNVGAMSAFSSAETACGGNACQCDPGWTKAEDGRTENEGVIDVECVTHVCLTYVR
jgi:hypothetical protein